MVIFVTNKDYMASVQEYIPHRMQIKLKTLRRLILILIQFCTSIGSLSFNKNNIKNSHYRYYNNTNY